MKYDIIVVFGSEKYYPKSGYKSASLFGIKVQFDVLKDNFVAINLKDNDY